jgi:hypothetical protein
MKELIILKMLNEVSPFIKAICMPASEELGLMMRDQVRYWRLNNIIRIMDKSQKMIGFDGNELNLKANPKVVLSIIDKGSLTDDDDLQNMWAGLVTSSCTEDGADDANLIFVNILDRMSTIQARITKHICEDSKKVNSLEGLLLTSEYQIPLTELMEIADCNDIQRLDREVDYMASQRLIIGGLYLKDDKEKSLVDDIVSITPTALLLNFYVRCTGHKGRIDSYWKNYIPNNEYKSPERFIEF